MLTVIHFSCKKEETVNVLQDKYEPTVKEAEFSGEDFVVNLNASVLQPGERGEWKIIKGRVVQDYVFIADKRNPFSKFKGLPGEEYSLEWTRWAKDGSSTVVQSKVIIPQLHIEIEDFTPNKFQTIISLAVNPKFRGKWTIIGAHGVLNSNYHDGIAEPPENKPNIEFHGYENTAYTVVYTYLYAGKTYTFEKKITTGSYTQDEGLYVLQLDRTNYRVTNDQQNNVIGLNLQASSIAWVFSEPHNYPALRSFKKLKTLILGGSSLGQIPKLFGEDYLELEELNMDRMGTIPIFPDNFGNLVNLKTLLFSPLYFVDPTNVVLLPKSFANLTSLESLSINSAGLIDFNGTLGSLIKLKTIKTYALALPDNIGNLQALQYLEMYSKNTTVPAGLSLCKSLSFIRLMFDDAAAGQVTLPTNIGNLKKLTTFEITAATLQRLPESLADLTALKTLKITAINLLTIPENFGNLSNLESLTLYGKFTRIPDSFGNLNKLTTLLTSSQTENLPESFGNLSELTYFNSESSALTTLPSSFGNLKKLKEIALRFSKIETLPASFGGLDALERLNLSDTKLKSFPKSLVQLKSINEITLNNTMTGDIPTEISGMKRGVAFYMYQVPNLTVAHLNYILGITKGKGFYTSFGYFATMN